MKIRHPMTLRHPVFDSTTHSKNKSEGAREQERKHAARARDRHTECYCY